MLTSWFFQYLHVEEHIYEISGEVIKVVVVAREIQPLKGSNTVQIGVARNYSIQRLKIHEKYYIYYTRNAELIYREQY